MFNFMHTFSKDTNKMFTINLDKRSMFHLLKFNT